MNLDAGTNIPHAESYDQWRSRPSAVLPLIYGHLVITNGPQTRIEVDRLQCDVSVIRVEGELNLTHAIDIELALRTAERDTHAVVVDLSSCSFMDSSGLSALLHSRRRLQRRGDRMALACRAHGSVDRLLEVAVPRVFELHPTRDAAVSRVCGPA